MDRLRGMDKEEVERLVSSLGDYELAIPDELVSYYLMRSGFKCDDIRVQRLVALAAQKFLADITNDAVSHCRMRQQSVTSRSKPKEARMLLTTEDLEKALREYGVAIRKPPYYADHPASGAQPTKSTAGPAGAAAATPAGTAAEAKINPASANPAPGNA